MRETPVNQPSDEEPVSYLDPDEELPAPYYGTESRRKIFQPKTRRK